MFRAVFRAAHYLQQPRHGHSLSVHQQMNGRRRTSPAYRLISGKWGVPPLYWQGQSVVRHQKPSVPLAEVCTSITSDQCVFKPKRFRLPWEQENMQVFKEGSTIKVWVTSSHMRAKNGSLQRRFLLSGGCGKGTGPRAEKPGSFTSCVTLEKSFYLSSLPAPQDCLSVKEEKMQTVRLSRIKLSHRN